MITRISGVDAEDFKKANINYGGFTGTSNPSLGNYVGTITLNDSEYPGIQFHKPGAFATKILLGDDNYIHFGGGSVPDCGASIRFYDAIASQVTSNKFIVPNSISIDNSITFYKPGHGLDLKDETTSNSWSLHMHGDRIRTYNGVTEDTYVTTNDTIQNAVNSTNSINSTNAENANNLDGHDSSYFASATSVEYISPNSMNYKTISQLVINNPNDHVLSNCVKIGYMPWNWK